MKMKTKRKTLNEKQLKQSLAKKPAELYRAPKVEVIDIELTQNFLGSTGGGEIPDMSGDDW